MEGMDPELERQRLLARYADMPDQELQELARDLESLTEPARLALKQELERRCIPMPVAEPSAVDDSSDADAYGPSDIEIRAGDFVAIAIIDFPGEAIVIQSYLRSVGIKSVLVDSFGQPMRSRLWGRGMRMSLQVSRQDAERALELLDTALPDASDQENDRD